MEEYLIVQVRNGSHEALTRLLEMNYEMVYKYLIKFTLSKNLAEDLVQETMLRTIEKIDLYDVSRSKFSTWLIAIAQNIYIDSIRKKKREKKYLEEDARPLDLYESYVGQDDSMEQVLEALSHLSDDIRTPIILKHYHGYSLEEIAAIMSIPVGTVKSRIHNGIKAVRKELE